MIEITSKSKFNQLTDVEEKFLSRFFQLLRYIKAKFDIPTFRQGSDEAFCEAWERLSDA